MAQRWRRLVARIIGRRRGASMQIAEVEYLTQDDARRLLEQRVWQHFQMSVDEFRVAWEHGKFTAEDEPRATRATEVAALLPLVSS